MIIGKKLGVIFALSLLCMSVLVAAPASAALTTDNTLTASPSSVKWGQSVTISYNVSVNGGYIWWNGTATLYLVNPEGTNSSYGSASAINLGDTTLADWANWSYEPRMSGTWTVWIIHAKTTGNGTYAQVTNETTTFSLEPVGDWMNRTVQDWTAIWWLMFGLIVLIVVMVVVFNRVSGDAGKKL